MRAMKLPAEVFGALQRLGVLSEAGSAEVTKYAAKLTPQASRELASGALVHSVLQVLGLAIHGESVSFEDADTPAAKLHNWTVIAGMLEAVGVSLDADTKVARAPASAELCDWGV